MRASALLLFLPLLVLPSLAGCTDADWNRLTSFGSTDRAEVTRAAAPAAPAAMATAEPAPPANAFCQDAARQDATSNGFDPATQQRVALRSYQQCVTIFGN